MSFLQNANHVRCIQEFNALLSITCFEGGSGVALTEPSLNLVFDNIDFSFLEKTFKKIVLNQS